MADLEPSSPIEDGHTNGNHADNAPFDTEAPRYSDLDSPAHMAASHASHPPSGSVDPAMAKAADAVLYSDNGVNALLIRLKQSVATARDLATFLKKRNAMEDDHSKELRRLCRVSSDSVRNRESRQDSFAAQFVEIISMHERMAENEMSFSLNLHQMGADLDNLAHDIERGRKQWKAQGLSAEQRVQEAEKALDKAKLKYYSLAEDYDHAKTGDKVSGRHIGFRPKSGAALEEDLQRKLNNADQDYQAKVQAAQQLREELESSARPQAVQSLLQLIKECDSGVALSLQKFAAFNEKLLLGNGLLISPLNDGESQRRSLREIVSHIDNDKDFHTYITGHAVPQRRENKYEQHHTQVPAQHKPVQQPPISETRPMPPHVESGQSHPPSQFPMAGQSQPPSQFPMAGQSQPPPQFPMGGLGPAIPAQNFQPFDPLNEKPLQLPPYPQDNFPPQGPPGRGYPQSPNQYSPGPGAGPPNQFPGPGSPSGYGQRPAQSHGPPGAGPMGGGMSGGMSGPVSSSMPAPRPGSRQNYPRPPPARPMFGVPLHELFVRDQSPVPALVYQCIQAVEQFGLDFEGIYRVSGASQQIAQLRDLFDNDAPSVDLRNPKAFFHDVNNPSTLLKQFLRELPDPLLTTQGYREFLNAAAIPDDIQRRDRLHAAINNLPDPNYATLRGLTLHLHRVMEHEQSNRMNSNSLALIFAPTLMGVHNGPVQDQALQHRAVETILLNAMEIFDED